MVVVLLLVLALLQLPSPLFYYCHCLLWSRLWIVLVDCFVFLLLLYCDLFVLIIFPPLLCFGSLCMCWFCVVCSWFVFFYYYCCCFGFLVWFPCFCLLFVALSLFGLYLSVSFVFVLSWFLRFDLCVLDFYLLVVLP